MQMAEIKDDTNRWKDTPSSWTGRINIVYNTQGVNLHVHAVLTKLPMTFLTETDQHILKLVWKHKRLQMAKGILKNKNRTGGIRLPD